MKKPFKIIIVACALIVGGCDRESAKQQHSVTQRKREWQDAVSAFAQKHGAILDWEAAIPQRGSRFDRTIFSVDVSRALLTSNGQPVLIQTDLTDVAKAGEEFVGYFACDFLTNYDFRLCLEVKCTREQVARLLLPGETLRYAVLARVAEVSRSSGIDSTFVAKGVCVDLLRQEPRRDSPKEL